MLCIFAKLLWFFNKFEAILIHLIIKQKRLPQNLLRIFFQGCIFFFSNHTNLEFGGASFLSEMMMTMGRNFMQRREIFQVMNGMCVTIKWLESVFFVFFFHCGTLGWVYVVFLNSFSWYSIFITFSLNL